jgi:hypothetical protein
VSSICKGNAEESDQQGDVPPVAKPISYITNGECNQACKCIRWHHQEIGSCRLESQLHSEDKSKPVDRCGTLFTWWMIVGINKANAYKGPPLQIDQYILRLNTTMRYRRSNTYSHCGSGHNDVRSGFEGRNTLVTYVFQSVRHCRKYLSLNFSPPALNRWSAFNPRMTHTPTCLTVSYSCRCRCGCTRTFGLRQKFGRLREVLNNPGRDTGDEDGQ